MSLEDLIKNRLEKLKKIKNSGILPYPQKVPTKGEIKEILKNFAKLEKAKKEVKIAGRILAWREHGGITFLDLQDFSGKIQIVLSKESLGEKGYSFFLENLDLGDIIWVKGTLFKTKRGEKSLKVRDFKLLAKAIRPLPSKWYGLKDVEERYRKRYLDLIFNPEVKEKFIKRAQILKAIREFLDQRGFIEVETPVLQLIYGGAEAKPFKTYLEAFDLEVYLRIAPELFLKRLIVGGFERVYEIGRVFRNEGVDRSHNPDFTMLEFYLAYADYKDMMKLTEDLILYIVKKVNKKLEIEYEGKKIKFKKPFQRVEYLDLLKSETGIDYFDLNLKGILEKAKKLKIKVEKTSSKEKVVDTIFKKVCLPKLEQPTFVIHHPKGMIPLAKPLDENPNFLGSFQLVIAGWEVVKAYSELNDPLLQAQVFKEQEEKFKGGDFEAQRYDKDFVEALEYGMPPTAGFGMGIDRITAILTNSHSLREVILFPTVKPKEE